MAPIFIPVAGPQASNNEDRPDSRGDILPPAASPRYSPIKKFLRILAGVGLIIIGIIGLILPVMPGWVFIVPGLVILAEHFHPIRRLVDWAKAKLESAEVPGWKGRKPDAAEAASAKMEDRP